MNTPVLLILTVEYQKKSNLGPYVNDMFQAVDCDLFLDADDTSFMYQHRDFKVTE